MLGGFANDTYNPRPFSLSMYLHSLGRLHIVSTNEMKYLFELLAFPPLPYGGGWVEGALFWPLDLHLELV